MSIGPVESTIFTNQQMASVASEKTSQNSRVDMQNVAAGEIAKDKEKEVKEVRPTEENHKINEDKEHQKHHAQDEQEEMEVDGEKVSDKDDTEQKPQLHILDIKV